MDFNYWFLVAGLVLTLMALAGTLLKRLPLSASQLYLLVGVAIGPLGIGLLAIDPIERVVVVPKLSDDPDVAGIRAAVMWRDCLVGDAQPLSFVTRRFNDPLFILYSSGTTGVPKSWRIAIIQTNAAQ